MRRAQSPSPWRRGKVTSRRGAEAAALSGSDASSSRRQEGSLVSGRDQQRFTGLQRLGSVVVCGCWHGFWQVGK